MTEQLELKDLIVLAPCLDIETTVTRLLQRTKAFGIRRVVFDVYRHPQRDAGCLREAIPFLASFRARYWYALVIFDRYGCGQEDRLSREEIERSVEGGLERSGWARRVAAIVLDPELEAWIWGTSPHVARLLGWGDREPSLHEWLLAEDLLEEGAQKPERPKEALEQALRVVGKPRSPAVYGQLADRVTLQRCVDPAFAKFKRTIQSWFGVP